MTPGFDDLINIAKNVFVTWQTLVALWIAIILFASRFANKQVQLKRDAEKSAFDHEIGAAQIRLDEMHEKTKRVAEEMALQSEKRARVLRNAAAEFRKLLMISMEHSDNACKWIAVLEAAVADRPELLRQKPNLGRSVTVADVASVYAEVEGDS